MATPQRIETVRRLQTAMAVSYSGMAAWCLIHPSSVIQLSLTAPYVIVNRTTELLMRCFGAQAMTSGLLLGISASNERLFTGFGLAMLPYLVFNVWFLFGPGQGVFTPWLWMDFLGNIFFACGSGYCAKLLREDREKNS